MTTFISSKNQFLKLNRKEMQKLPGLIKLGLLLCVLATSFSCTHTNDTCDYPDAVGKIIVSKCATSGCHNTLSKDVTGGYDFSTWSHMFQGGRNGSPVIPFRPDQSLLKT